MVTISPGDIVSLDGIWPAEFKMDLLRTTGDCPAVTIVPRTMDWAENWMFGAPADRRRVIRPFCGAAGWHVPRHSPSGQYLSDTGGSPEENVTSAAPDVNK